MTTVVSALGPSQAALRLTDHKSAGQKTQIQKDFWRTKQSNRHIPEKELSCQRPASKLILQWEVQTAAYSSLFHFLPGHPFLQSFKLIHCTVAVHAPENNTVPVFAHTVVKDCLHITFEWSSLTLVILKWFFDERSIYFSPHLRLFAQRSCVSQL